MTTTCHLHFWQNDCCWCCCSLKCMLSTAIAYWGRLDYKILTCTEGWPRRRKKISHHSYWGIKPTTFKSRVQCSTTELISMPLTIQPQQLPSPAHHVMSLLQCLLTVINWDVLICNGSPCGTRWVLCTCPARSTKLWTTCFSTSARLRTRCSVQFPHQPRERTKVLY